MILMTPAQLLLAIRRGLEENVLPELKKDYARVQLLAALVAIKELEHRIQEGDPCIGENGRYQESMKQLSESMKAGSPSTADQIARLLRESEGIGDPRKKNRHLKEGIYRIVKESNDADAMKVLGLVAQNISATFAGDAKWICPEALASLHG